MLPERWAEGSDPPELRLERQVRCPERQERQVHRELLRPERSERQRVRPERRVPPQDRSSRVSRSPEAEARFEQRM